MPFSRPRSYQALRSQFGSDCRMSAKDHAIWGRMIQRTLHKTSQHFATSLQQRVAHHDLHESLQPFPPVLNHVVAESIRKHFPRQRRNGHTGALALQNVSKVFKVGVPPAHDGVLQFKGGDVRSTDDLVRGVHVSRRSMGLRVSHLGTSREIIQILAVFRASKVDMS